MAKSFKYTQQGDIGELIFNLPKQKANILKSAVLIELDQLLDRICQEPLKALIVKSSKKKIFIAGADISEIEDIRSEDDAKEKVSQGQHIFNKIEALPYITIALIDGACLGGGLELALACDFRVATDDPSTKIGLPEVNLGIIPGFGGTQRLPKLIGYTNAVSLILAGKIVNGKKAFKLKMIDACYPKGYLQFKLPEFIKKAINNPKSIRLKRRRSGLLPCLERFALTRLFLTLAIKKKLIQKTRKHYPAPLAALAVMHKTYNLPLNKGLQIEADYFGRVAPTDVSKNLIQLFHTSEQLKKDPGVKNEVESHSIETVSVLGAGVMGGGIAWLFSKLDIPVRMKDLHWGAILKGFQQAFAIYKQLIKMRKYDQREISNKMNKISGGIEYSGFQNSSLVIEAVVENLDTKKKVLKELEAQVKSNAIIASNTSSLSIDEMALALKKPERFIGMHFFNPVNRMPLVEIIPGKKTNPKTVATTVGLAKKAGKTPIVVRNGAGFVVNRILLPYINEAGFILEAGGNPQTIDSIIYQFGMPMGPLTLLDEVGIDVGYKVAVVLNNAFGDRMRVCELFKELYETKRLLGKKSGKGIYLHNGQERSINPEVKKLLNTRKTKNKHILKQDILKRCLFIMVNEAARCLEEKIIEKPEYLDMAMVLGTGFPPFRGGLLKYADTIGIQQVFLELESFRQKYGDRFTPSKLIQKMANNNLNFYN